MKDIRKVIGLLLCMTICCYMTGEEKKNLNIVFIGNSITQGALLENPRHEAPPVKAALYPVSYTHLTLPTTILV